MGPPGGTSEALDLVKNPGLERLCTLGCTYMMCFIRQNSSDGGCGCTRGFRVREGVTIKGQQKRTFFLGG